VLGNDAPGLVRVSVVTNNLGRQHVRGDEETVARRSLGGGEARLESLKEIECGVGHRLGEASTVESVGNEKVESYRKLRGALDGWGELGTGEQVGNEVGGNLRQTFVAVVRVGHLVRPGFEVDIGEVRLARTMDE